MCPLDFSGNFCSTKKIPYREIFCEQKRKLVIHCKIFVKTAKPVSFSYLPCIHQQIPTIRSAGGQAVTALVSGMTVMTLDPVERHFMRFIATSSRFQRSEFFTGPVLGRTRYAFNPAVDPFLVESVHEIFRIGIKVYLTGPV